MGIREISVTADSKLLANLVSEVLMAAFLKRHSCAKLESCLKVKQKKDDTQGVERSFYFSFAC